VSVKQTPLVSVKQMPPLVLYAEDNRLLAAPVKDVLELAGCRVEHCADGVTALAMLKTAGTRAVRYDLVLLDNELPSLGGLEVLRAARAMKEWRATPFILCALEDCAEAAREAGADEFLRKPNNLLTLADAVRRLLSKSRQP
jgi:CheY-like chemotaxis protein